MTQQPADLRGEPSTDPDGRQIPEDQQPAPGPSSAAHRSPWAAPLGSGAVSSGGAATSGAIPASNSTPISDATAPGSDATAPGSDRDVTQEYSPVPEPRTEWARVAAGSPEPSTPEAWFEQPVTRVVNVPAQRRTWSLGLLLSVSVISAVLASGGTFLALNASGVLNRPTPSGSSATSSLSAQQQVSLEESSAVIA